MNGKILPLLSQTMMGDFLFSTFGSVLKFLESVFILALWLAAITAFIFLIHFLFSLPMRRMERARQFLDLVEGALKRGQPIEDMIVSVAQSRDRSVGVRFYLLSAYIESGLQLVAALQKVPRFLPPQIVAILLAGQELGDIKRVLPACREILRDHPAAVRSAVNYLIVVILFFSPVFIFVMMMTMIFVVPKFRDVAAGMGVQLHPLTLFVFANTRWLITFEIIITVMIIFATLAYIGGPGFVRWFQFRGLPVVDWIAWRVPWKHKRLQRTFSAMLAVLLDNGVPEAEAVRLAGNCTVNEICRRRSQNVITSIQQGMKLDEAVRAFDDNGEFHWRLTNATHSHNGFLNALRGWHEALDAKAFQQEESTAHIVTSSLVILNGVFVALIATAMFAILMAVLNGMVL